MLGGISQMGAPAPAPEPEEDIQNQGEEKLGKIQEKIDPKVISLDGGRRLRPMAASRGRMAADRRPLLAEAYKKVSSPSAACPGSPGKAAHRRYAPDRVTTTILPLHPPMAGHKT